MKNVLLYFFRVSLFQNIHEMSEFRKLSEKHAKKCDTTILTHLFAFIIKKITLNWFSIFASSKLTYRYVKVA